MSAQERHNFLVEAADRAPGKRRIKPSAAFFSAHVFGGADEDEEDDTTFSLPNGISDSATKSASSSEFGTDDEEKEDEKGSSGGSGSSLSDEEEEMKDEGGKSGYESDNDDEMRQDEKDVILLENEPSSSNHVTTEKRRKKSKLNGLMAKIMTTSSGIGQALDHQQQLCAICLNLRPSDHCGELIQCDRCALSVHEGCYGSMSEGNGNSAQNQGDSQSTGSSASTEPWFCEPCLLNCTEIPHCELCPNRYGAFKKTDIGDGWIHLLCALFVPGVSFSDVDHLSGVSWQEIDARNFGRKPCHGCTDGLEARTGITIRCDAGLCKNYYHVTCAQRLGLLIDLESEAHRHQKHTSRYDQKTHHHNVPRPNHSAEPSHSETGFVYCKKHVQKDVVQQQKNTYAKFLEQEERRMVQWNRMQLDVRQERKRQAQLHEYRNRLKNLEGITITMPTQKHMKMIQTNARYLNAFAEKHELLGLSREQFAEEFAAVPPAQLPPNLPCAFTRNFHSYVTNRDRCGLPDEETRLEQLRDDFCLKQQRQFGIEQQLEKSRKRSIDLQHEHAENKHLLERFRMALEKIVPHLPLLAKTPPPPEDDGQKKNKPVNKKRSIQSTKQQKATTSGGRTDETAKMETPEPPQKPTINECHKCKKAINPHLLIYCDTCKHYYHIGCLDPPLTKMPPKDKFSRFECSDCAYPSSDEGEAGKEQLEADGSKNKDEVALQEDWALLEHRSKRQRRTRKSSLLSIVH